ncbi:MAG: dTDP-4-dehydrorhamnose 3,5-epimerase family protein, partial [Candidatus Marsarchaeota archaeon]|nr:dTDP-4-dehydrorhamnose 3,5-epimerase family protein [Candidatus Marsarchaeota archaeon]
WMRIDNDSWFEVLCSCPLAEVFYQMSEFYAPDYARGVRWNDPAFGIVWPISVAVISDRDANYPDFVSHG